MRFIPTALIVIFVFISFFVKAQNDSTFEQLQKFPANNFLYQTQKKVDQYKERIYHKTIKSLEKLSRWEDKIKKLLDKASPETSAQLFSDGKLSFNSLLEKYKKGESVLENNMPQYDAYRDKLSTSLKYIGNAEIYFDSVLRYKCLALSNNIKQLDNNIGETEAIDKIITERKKLLLTAAVQFIGKSKWLVKINKETYYYSETLINYKQLFDDPGKSQKLALDILNKIPAFKHFFKSNSQLSSLFSLPGNDANEANLQGLQTRAAVNTMVRNSMGTINLPQTQQLLSAQLQLAQSQLNKVKDKLLKNGISSNWDGETPLGNKAGTPNNQHSKTFKQRLDLSTNLQFGKSQGWLPSTADIGFGIGYKLNDKSTIGLGVAYKLGLGSIKKIKFSHEGIGFRSFFDWKAANEKTKIFKNIYLSGGFEMNYIPALADKKILTYTGSDTSISTWQKSGLIGFSKKVNSKSKYIRSTKIQILYDIFHPKQASSDQRWIIRMGYGL